MLPVRVHSCFEKTRYCVPPGRNPPRPGFYAYIHGFTSHARHSRLQIAAMLFRIYHKNSPAKWMVLLDGQHYGEYLDKNDAISDAIEAAKDAHACGQPAEVWEDAARVY
jgi:hypothetical protein